MKILNALVWLFLLPGSLALKGVSIDNQEDGGTFRSMINMLFWGVVAVIAMIPFMGIR